MAIYDRLGGSKLNTFSNSDQKHSEKHSNPLLFVICKVQELSTRNEIGNQLHDYACHHWAM